MWHAPANAQATVQSSNVGTGPGNQTNPELTVTGDSQGTIVHIVYEDEEQGSIVYSTSSDGGESFTVQHTLANLSNPDIAAGRLDGEEVVYIAVQADETLGNDLYVYTMNAQTGDILHEVDVGGTGDVLRPRIATNRRDGEETSNAYVLWVDSNVGTDDLYFSQSTSGGASFSNGENVSTDISHADIAYGSGCVWAVTHTDSGNFNSEAGGTPKQIETFTNCTPESAGNWSEAVSISPGSLHDFPRYPSIAAGANGEAAVAFEAEPDYADPNDLGTDVVTVGTSDSGQTWSTAQPMEQTGDDQELRPMLHHDSQDDKYFLSHYQENTTGNGLGVLKTASSSSPGSFSSGTSDFSNEQAVRGVFHPVHTSLAGEELIAWVRGEDSGDVQGQDVILEGTASVPPIPGDLSVTPTNRNVGSLASQTTFNVINQGEAGITWNVTSDKSWAQITEGATGTDDGTFTVSVERNPTLESRTANISVDAGDGGTRTVTVTQSGRDSDQPRITSVVGSPQSPGEEFWLDIKVGSSDSPVEDLFGASFVLGYDSDHLSVVDNRVGPFLGTDLTYVAEDDPSAGTVGFGISNKAGSAGADGSGIIARVKFAVNSNTPEGTEVVFNLSDFSGTTSTGEGVSMAGESSTIRLETQNVVRVQHDRIETLQFPDIESVVTITDGSQDAIEGLTQANFTVNENGIPQTVLNFEQLEGGTYRIVHQSSNTEPDGSERTVSVVASYLNDSHSDGQSYTAPSETSVPIAPTADAPRQPGDEFWVNIRVGRDEEPVSDLFAASFVLNYNTQYLSVVEDEAGPFLGGDVVYSSNSSANPGEVGIGISQKFGNGGADGDGVVARVKFAVDTATPVGQQLQFSVHDVVANNPIGNPILLDPQALTVGIVANRGPDTEEDVGETQEGSDVSIDVLANDSDSNSGLDLSSLTVVEAPSDGIATVDAETSTLVYSPDDNFVGLTTFKYTVADGQGAVSNPTTVYVAVNALPAGDGPTESASAAVDVGFGDDVTAATGETGATFELRSVGSIGILQSNFFAGSAASTEAANAQSRNENKSGVSSFAPEDEFSNVSTYRWEVGKIGADFASADIIIDLSDEDIGGIGDPAMVTIIQDENGDGLFQSVATSVDQGGTPDNPSDDVLIGTGLSSLGTFRLASNDDANPLPVELATFDARQQPDAVTLSWQTVSEVNNAGFEVQRRSKAGSFQRLGFVEGTGTTSEPQDYRFRDAALPFADSLAYRLKQIDTDGTAEFSAEIVVRQELGAEVQLEAPFPNPTRQRATIRYTVTEGKAQPVLLEVYNVLGQRVTTLVDRVQSPGRSEQTVDTGRWASGVYLVRLRIGNTVRTQRLTVVR